MNADKNYVMIIDSLTNGNIYEILGNFFQLFDRMTIDDNYRKKHSSVYDISVSEEAITWFTKGTDGNGTGLSEGVKSRMAESGNKIFLPENLYVMCTENTSHRSRYVLDTAFKRRFKLVYINDEGIVYGNIPNSRVDGVNYDDDNRFISREGWNNIRKIINEKIAQITNVEDKQLTEHFVRFTEDDKIAMLDFITCVVSHLIEIEKRFHDDRIIYKEYQSVEKVMEHKNDIVEIFSDEIKNDIMKIMNVNE